MSRPDVLSRVRTLVVGLTAPLGAAGLIACDASDASLLEPGRGPQFAYGSGGNPELASCSDPTPGQKWTVEVTPAGGTFNMGPNTIVVPANAVAATGMIYLRELSATSLKVSLSSSVALNASLEVIMSAENCETQATQTVWLYDQTNEEFEQVVNGAYLPNTENMRFWTIQPGAYALAD